ncbi:unnamed protein product [Lactuca saligna]|uniref:Uncharacterized protein n=1 Tax=Lactuca saligna TaxID=75948 RepID=A0AA36DZ91_LACSI|nr:unnamed protein product [Lactuca saligna]
MHIANYRMAYQRIAFHWIALGSNGPVLTATAACSVRTSHLAARRDEKDFAASSRSPSLRIPSTLANTLSHPVIPFGPSNPEDLIGLRSRPTNDLCFSFHPLRPH